MTPVASKQAGSAHVIDGSVSLLYAVTGDATLSGRTLQLVPDGGVRWIADRPARNAGNISASHLVESWPAAGFDTDPPNAVLMTTTASIPVELSQATWVPTSKTMGLTVTPLAGAKLPSGDLGRVELFIDDAYACDDGNYQLQVSDFPSGATPPADCDAAVDEYLSEWNATVHILPDEDPVHFQGQSPPYGVTIFGMDWTCQMTAVSVFTTETMCHSGSDTMTWWMVPQSGPTVWTPPPSPAG